MRPILLLALAPLLLAPLAQAYECNNTTPVSYTHLTLPTICSV